MSTRKGRKITGGKYIARRKKKSYEIIGQRKTVKLGETLRKVSRIRGGRKKIFLVKIKNVNVNGKVLEIKNVLETPSNRFLARQNIITKGTILQTDQGKIKVTNRPTQQGMVNGILIK